MYYVTCDGFPLLDWRDNELILESPRVKLEVNTIGEGSFTIYKNHPHYDKLQKLKSVFEVSDEIGVIFRGRATSDTIDFNHGKAVDLEGAMGYFNDSVIRPFNFPEDFQKSEEYKVAVQSGNVVQFLLSWFIEQHNAQVQDFQKMKLGNVTVADPNNYITRSNTEYSSTWDALKSKLFGSSLGGYLCIRYEDDGNYIDYLSAFEDVNTQKIEFGENLLDLTSETTANATYSAIIPIGAEVERTISTGTIEGEYVDFETTKTIKETITLSSLPDGDVTSDLVKSGDILYSKNAVEQYGFICAPVSVTKWDDVTEAENLLTKGINWMTGSGMLLSNTIEVTAVDLHFTDDEVQSLRIYKNVTVFSAPHGLDDRYPLTRLEIDLLNPQNTKIAVGKTIMTLTDKTSINIDKIIQETNSTTNKYFNDVIVKVVESQKSSLPPGEYRVFGEVNGLDIKLSEVDDDKVHEYTFEFVPTSTFTGLKITPEVRWASEPQIQAGLIHQVSILRGIGVMISA